MAEANTSEKLKVFISYSRRDSSEFAEDLVSGLELGGFAPFLDRLDIAPGEPWEERLGGLIQQADTVVYVISPAAVKSERCEWEVDRTLALAKRLLPVVFRPVPEAAIPERLRERQFIRFDAGPGIIQPLAQLADALRQDIDWIREHTRLGELATRWEARKRSEALLLRGEELTAAQSWLEKRKPDAPAVTDTMRAFIAASNDSETASLRKSNIAQRRVIQMQVLTTALLVLVILGLVGWINQSYIAEQWRWWTVTRPYMLSEIKPYVLSADKVRTLKSGDSFKECATGCPEMVVIPAGTFTMGGSDKVAQPKHEVKIPSPFAVSKYEMTFTDWDVCAGHSGCMGYRPNDLGFGRGDQPVINVSWDDAKRYLAWLSRMTGKTYRLLTEAEYEYAARGGTTTVYPWGDDIKLNGQAMANCGDCGSQWDGKQPAPVDSFRPNGFGLYQMVGNVFSWVEDCWHGNYDGAPVDSSAWIVGGNCNHRVVRGGAFEVFGGGANPALRDALGADIRNPIEGFRIARTLNQ